MPIETVTNSSWLGDRERLRERGVDPARRPRVASSSVGDLLEQHRELVAAEAGHGVARPRSTLRCGRATAHQQLVADRVAEAVVDHLEAVEVEEEHGEEVAVAAPARAPGRARGGRGRARGSAGR